MLTNLDTFVDHYITAALWSSTDDKGTPLDDPKYRDRLAHEAREAMREDCRAWLATNADLCAELEQVADYGMHPDCGTVAPKAAACAHDLWLTRNGHGSGFWDRDLPGDLGDRLTKAAHAAGERGLYVGDDGQLYCD